MALMSLENTRSKWTAPVIMKDCEVHCPSTCVALGVLFTDNDSKLIIAHGGHRGTNMKLKIFQALELHSESVLADMPTSLIHFVTELSSIPSVAVAAGPSLLVYKNLKPYYKFTVPSSDMIPTEMEAWKAVGMKKISPETFLGVLKKISDDISFSRLTAMSQSYLLATSREQHLNLIEKFGEKIYNSAPITCVTKMAKSTADSMDILAVGTEHREIYFVDSQAFTVLDQLKIESVPVTMCAYGSFDVDYKLFVHTRDSLIFCIKRGEEVLHPIVISQSMITGMIMINKTIIYSTNENFINFVNFKGKKINTVKCQDKIKMMEPFYYTHKQLSAVIAVFEKEIRMYNEHYLLDTVRYEKPLAWIKYGCYGREDSTLIVAFKDGSIAIQIFRRTANFDNKLDYNQIPQAHALKLQIPKKTKVFIDSTSRELEYAKKIHQAYQKYKFNLKFKVAEAYQQLSSSASATVSTSSVLPMEISVDINGFGPTFRMTVFLLSASKQNLYDMQLSIIADPEHYEIDTPLIPVTILVPGQSYSFTTLLECKDPEKAGNGEIRALLVHPKRALPIVTAIIKMPFSEFPVD